MITDGNQRRAIAFGKVDDNVSYLFGAGQTTYHFPPLTYGSLGATNAQTVAAPIGAASWRQAPTAQHSPVRAVRRAGVGIRWEPIDRMGGVIHSRVRESVGLDHVRPLGPLDIDRHHSSRRLCTTSKHRVGDDHNGSRIRPPVHSSAEYPRQGIRRSGKDAAPQGHHRCDPISMANPRILPRVLESPTSLFLDQVPASHAASQR